MHQKSREKVQIVRLCTKRTEKRCKQSDYAPKEQRKSANGQIMHQKSREKVQTVRLCTKRAEKKCKHPDYAPKE